MNKQIALQRTRMYAALRESHPIYFGDPVKFYGYGGPAWGERNSGGAGLLGAVLAVATGGASLGFTTLASSLTTISLVSSVVGAVTGNKALSTFGAIAGLSGTFMNLSAAGTFGKDMAQWAGDTNVSIMGSGAEQVAAPVQDAIVNNVSEAGVVGADTMSQAAAAGGNANMLTDANLQNADTVGLVSEPNMIAADGTAAGVSSEPNMIAADGTAAGANNIQQPAAATAVDTVTSEPSLMSRVASPEKTAAAIKASGGGIETGPSLWDTVSKFTKENKELVQVGLTGIQGMYTSPEKEALMRSQTDYYNAKTAETAGQTNNANAVPSVAGLQVNRGAQIYNQKPVVAAGVHPAGLIQSRRV